MIDLSALLYGPVYGTFGVPALLLPRAAASAVTVTAIDLTAGLQVKDSSPVVVQTIRPAAAVRVVELTEKGVLLADVDEGTIELNGKSWRIKTHLLKPSPEGELAGEVYLILIDENAATLP